MFPENITQAGQKATELSGVAGQMGAELPRIGDVLKQKVTEAYQSNQDIVKPLDVATQTYLGGPQAGREKYQDIFNPFQRENLVSQYIGNLALPMLSLSSMLGQRQGGIADIIGAGTRGYESATLGAQSQAGIANQAYQNLLNEYQMGESTRQSQVAEQLAREKFEWDKTQPTGGGGGGMGIDLLSLLGGFGGLGEGQTIQPTEPEPMYSPAQGIGAISPGGEWYFDGREWIPIVD